MPTGQTQLVSARPDGTQPKWLGSLGHVTQLVYGSKFFGGFGPLSGTLQLPANYRIDAVSPGRRLTGYRGGQVVWDGIMNEPSVDANGWNFTGTGLGDLGDNFDAVYSNWVNQNDAVNQAITRGLPWKNSGIPSSVWLGQQIDSGAQRISDLLNLFCLQGNFGWSVDRYGNLSVATLPTTPVRTLICTTPVSRTLAGFYNTIYIRYCNNIDSLSNATFTTTVVTNSASIAKHGPLEGFIDLSSAGLLTAGQAQGVGNSILSRYVAVGFSNAFTVHHGELTTLGGQPVDLGSEMAGGMVRLVLTDYGYGGDLTPEPPSFIIGEYQYDDIAQIATITPFLSVRRDFAGLIGEVQTVRDYTFGFGGTAAGERVTREWQRLAARQARWRREHPPHSTGSPEHWNRPRHRRHRHHPNG